MNDPVVFSGQRHMPLAEVKQRAARLGQGLRSLGIGHGDRYGFVMRNEIGFLEANLAAAAIGAVPAPVNWHWTGDDLAHLLSDSGIKLVIVHTDLLPAVEAYKPGHVAIVEAVPPEEVTEAYGLGPVTATGRYPTLDSLIEGNEPPAPVQTPPPMAVIYTSGTTGLAKGILRNPVKPEPARGRGLGQAVQTTAEGTLLDGGQSQ